MLESSSSPATRTSNLHSLILQRVATVKNSSIAVAIAHDEGHISRITSGERGLRITELEPFFKALSLRVIECDGQVSTIPTKELEAYKLLAGLHCK